MRGGSLVKRQLVRSAVANAGITTIRLAARRTVIAGRDDFIVFHDHRAVVFSQAGRSHELPLDETAAAHGSQYGSCVAVHAEQNAIISASRQELQGSTLYLVGYDPRTKKWIEAKPCNMCDRMIRNAGILRVVRREIDE